MADQPGSQAGLGTVAALMLNSMKSVDTRIAGTAFRTNSLRYRSSVTGQTGPRLGETFLLNTQLRRDDRESQASVMAYYEEPVLRMLASDGVESIPALAELELVHPEPLPLRLDQCLARRRSRRLFTGDAIDANQLAAIIRAGAGVTTELEAMVPGSVETVKIRFRTAPSPGGLFAVDLYLAIQRVGGIPQGLYRYVPRHDRLHRLQDAAVLSRLRDTFSFPDELISVSKANVIFVLLLRTQKLMRKYGDRGIRYAFIEAGEITQSIHLAVAALGFGSVECASFYDAEMLEVVGLDSSTDAVLHTILVGVPSDAK